MPESTVARARVRDLAFCDLETSGLDHRDPNVEIIELAAVRLDPMTLAERAVVHHLVRPTKPVPEAAARVNGYTAERWEHAIPLRDGLEALAPVLDGAVFCGQNTPFDLGFLRRDYAAFGLRPPNVDRHTVDLMSLAYPLVLAGAVPSVSLRHLMRFFGLGDQQHHALGDVRAEVLVFKLLMQRYCNFRDWRPWAGDPKPAGQQECRACGQWGDAWPYKVACPECGGHGAAPRQDPA